MQRTLSIIKPDGVAAGQIGEVIARLEQNGLRAVALKMLRLTDEQARGFYDIHRERPFFESLVKFMTSGPVVVMILEGEDAINRYREVMGPTDSSKAPKGTIRGDLGTSIEKNVVHGSDAVETSSTEIGFFFNSLELARR